MFRHAAGGNGLIFAGSTGEPIRRKTFSPVRSRALRAAGITEHVRLRWLRHSGASLAYDATKDMVATAQRLGHASTRMVDSTYIEIYSEVSRQIADAIDEAVSRDVAVSDAGQVRDVRIP